MYTIHRKGCTSKGELLFNVIGGGCFAETEYAQRRRCVNFFQGTDRNGRPTGNLTGSTHHATSSGRPAAKTRRNRKPRRSGAWKSFVSFGAWAVSKNDCFSIMIHHQINSSDPHVLGCTVYHSVLLVVEQRLIHCLPCEILRFLSNSGISMKRVMCCPK